MPSYIFKATKLNFEQYFGDKGVCEANLDEA